MVQIEKDANFDKTKQIKCRNNGTQRITFDVSAVNAARLAALVELVADQIGVPARGSENVDVSLIVPTAPSARSRADSARSQVSEVHARTAVNSGFALHVPTYLVPRVLANVELKVDDSSSMLRPPRRRRRSRTRTDAIASTADFYAWGLEDGNDGPVDDVRSVGVQAFTLRAGDADAG